MGSAAKTLFLEAMKLDESNELTLAATKYLEALLQFGSTLLESARSKSPEEIQSKTFGDQTKAALQCLERVYDIHQHFHKQAAPTSLSVNVSSHHHHEKPLSSPSSSSPTSTTTVAAAATTSGSNLKHTESMAHKATIHPNHVSPSQVSPLTPVAFAIEYNKRLIAQFQEKTRPKDDQKLTEVQIARMETDLQRKLAENLAIAQHQSVHPAAGSSQTLPRNYHHGRHVSESSSGESHHHSGRSKKLGRQNAKRSTGGSSLTSWASMGPSDNLGLAAVINDRWRSKSGDRRKTSRASSESSLFEESDFANLLNDGDSDNEVPVPPNGILATIEDSFGADACAAMTPEQRHQQQVIIELIHTERTHVRAMKVLQKLFYRPLARSNILPRNFVSYMPMTFLELVFANLDEVVEMHTIIGKELKAIEKSHRIVNNIGSILIKYFDGEFGERFRSAVVQFCEHQQFALEQLQLRRQQDNALANMLKMAESHPACHGFKLSDLLPTEMQRLSKYPLLFERLLKHADPSDHKETERLQMCFRNAQDILLRMNSRKRDFENSKKLAEIQSRMDTAPFYRVQHRAVSEFPRFSLQGRGFVYEGPLRMRRIDSAMIDMHGVLCDQILLLLTKRGFGSDERLRLQFHEEKVSGGHHGTVIQSRRSPIIKLHDAKLKDSASCDKDFYIITTSRGEEAVYHLLTTDMETKTKWVKAIQKQLDTLASTPQPESIGLVSSISVGADTSVPSDSSNKVIVIVDDADADQETEEEDHDFDDFSDDALEDVGPGEKANR